MVPSKQRVRGANSRLRPPSKKLIVRLSDLKRLKNPLKKMPSFASDAMGPRSTRKVYHAGDATALATSTASSSHSFSKF